MAYLTHSPYRAYPVFARGRGASDLRLFTGCMIAALGVSVAVLALSSGDGRTDQISIASKTDRLVAAAERPTFGLTASGAREFTAVQRDDRAARTTTVSKGVVAELSDDSPFAAR